MVSEKYLSLCLAFIVFSQPAWSGQTEKSLEGAELEESSEETWKKNEFEVKSWKGLLEIDTKAGHVGKRECGKEGNLHGFHGCLDEETPVRQHAMFALLRISAEGDGHVYEDKKIKIWEAIPVRYRQVETPEIEVVRWKVNGEHEIWFVENLHGDDIIKEEAEEDSGEATVKEELVAIDYGTMDTQVNEGISTEGNEEEEEYIIYGAAPRVKETTNVEEGKQYILYGSVPFTMEEGKKIYYDHVVLVSVLTSVLLLVLIVVVCVVAATKFHQRRQKNTDEEALIGPEGTDGGGDKEQIKHKKAVVEVEPPLQDTPDPKAPPKQHDEPEPAHCEKTPDMKQSPDAPPPDTKPPELEMPSPGLFASSGFTPPPVMPYLTGESETESDELSRFIGIVYDGQMAKLTSDIPLSKDTVPEICSRLLSRAGIIG
uniref:uncharacterized protein isoform X2 n=1 Tax=Myxine glutinosa TaxID=7769 RepID=UPI00358F551A